MHKKILQTHSYHSQFKNYPNILPLGATPFEEPLLVLPPQAYNYQNI